MTDSDSQERARMAADLARKTAEFQILQPAGRAAELADAVAVPGLPNAESQFAIPLLVRDELIGVFSIVQSSPVQAGLDQAGLD